jgi:hypothetical protein
MKSEYQNEVKNTESYKSEHDAHQGILDVAYGKWQEQDKNSKKHWSYFDMVNWAFENGGPDCAAAILIGKYNQQVGNGGHLQYFDNGYASGEGGAFSRHSIDDLPAHEMMMELMVQLKLSETDIGTKVLGIMKEFVNDLEFEDEVECETCGGSGESECEECGGEGFILSEVEGEEGEEGEEDECSECRGSGYAECGDCMGQGTVAADREQISEDTIERLEKLDDRYYEIDEPWMEEMGEFCRKITEGSADQSTKPEVAVETDVTLGESEEEMKQEYPSWNESLTRLEKELNKILEDAASDNKCKKLDKEDWACKPGCKELDVGRGEECPFETDKEAKDCPCYEGSSKAYKEDGLNTADLGKLEESKRQFSLSPEQTEAAYELGSDYTLDTGIECEEDIDYDDLESRVDEYLRDSGIKVTRSVKQAFWDSAKAGAYDSLTNNEEDEGEELEESKKKSVRIEALAKDLQQYTKGISEDAEKNFGKQLKQAQKKGYEGERLDGWMANVCQDLSNAQLTILYAKYNVPDMDDTVSVKRATTWLAKKKG